MKTLRIAVAQINPTVGDLKNNTAKIINYIRQAKEKDADIVIFPELVLSGYPPEDLLFKKSFLFDCAKQIETIAEETADITALVGYPHFKDNRLYNGCAVLNNGKHLYTYSKIHLPNYGVFDEMRYFDSGSEIPVLQLTDSLNLGISICEDIWVSDTPLFVQGVAGNAIVCINISASPFHIGKNKLRVELLKERSRETKGFTVYANLIGAQDELIFDGGSLIIDPKGRVMGCAGLFAEELMVADLDLEVYSSIRQSNPEFVLYKRQLENDPRPLKYIKLDFDERKLSSKKIEIPALPVEFSKADSIEIIYDALTVGVRDYVKKNGFESVVIGLSGGIDSALTAAIAVDAIGAENVVGVSMPSKYSSYATQEDAKKLARNLGIKLMIFPIEEVLKSYQGLLDENIKGISGSLAEENLQARIRGNILMALSNRFGWLVLSTGNKSELGVGYCTLYGDMAGGFAVLKDVPKELVYKLSHYKNDTAKKEVIPDTVITRPPTAELRPNQKDSDSLPAYEVLDPMLEQYIEEDIPYSEMVKNEFDPETIKRVIKMVDHNEYKRRQAPVGIKITPRAFGKDRRMPITNKYQQF